MGKSRRDVWCIRGIVREPAERLLEEDAQECIRDGGGYVWTPLADVVENEREIVVVVELPGVPADRLVVEVADCALVVRGERPCSREKSGTAHHVVELAHGPFARRFPAPGGVDWTAVTASLRDGLLTVVLPKRARRMPPHYTLIPD